MVRYIQTDIINSRSAFAEFEVINNVITPEGKVLGTANSTVGISPKISITVTQTIVVENINLWSAESPYLYPNNFVFFIFINTDIYNDFLFIKLFFFTIKKYNVTSDIVIGGKIIDSVVTTIGIRKVLFDVDQVFNTFITPSFF